MSGEQPKHIVLPPMNIVANEKDEGKSAVDDVAEAAAGTVKKADSVLDASAKRVATPKGKAKTAESEPAPKVNERVIRNRLSKENDDILRKVAGNPNVGSDPYEVATVRIARQILQERSGSGRSSGGSWYKFW